MFNFIRNLINFEKIQFLFGVRHKEYPRHIEFRMQSSYLWQRPQQTTNGDISTPSSTNKEIVNFYFINGQEARIGRSSEFYGFSGGANRRRATYYFEGEEDRTRFLDSVGKGGGSLRARVQTSDNEWFVYKCSALTQNWEKVIKSRHPTLSDNFRCLVVRE